MKVVEMIHQLETIRDNNEGGADLEVFVIDDDRHASPAHRLEVAILNDPDDSEGDRTYGPKDRGVGIHWV